MDLRLLPLPRFAGSTFETGGFTRPRRALPSLCFQKFSLSIRLTLVKTWPLFLLWVATMACTAQAKQLAVIANSANPASGVSTAELAQIFNARMQSWQDETAIKVVVRDPSAAEMRLVLRTLLDMSPAQAEDFLQTHHGRFIVADSDDAVVKFVSSTRGAIGVVDLYSINSTVKVLKIDGKLPVEQGYLLRGN